MSVELAGLTLDNPVLVASGCGGTGRELAAYGALADLGGFVTRSITLNPRTGGPLPRIVETPSGLVHAVGLQNPGLEPFLASELPWLVQQGARVVVSIARLAGSTPRSPGRLGRAPGVAAIEVNLSSPDAPTTGCSTCASRSTPPASSRPCTATCRAGCRCWPSCAPTWSAWSRAPAPCSTRGPRPSSSATRCRLRCRTVARPA